MTYGADKEDLARHEAETMAQETFNYAVLNDGETELLGCVYIDPADEKPPPGSDAVASWWLVNRAIGTHLERALDDFVRRWLPETWGFGSVHYFPRSLAPSRARERLSFGLTGGAAPLLKRPPSRSAPSRLVESPGGRRNHLPDRR